MKRILVVDESRAVRETLGLILGREFIVVQRPLLPEDSLRRSELQADLVILGAPPRLGTEFSYLLNLASRLLCPILFILESKSDQRLFTSQERVDCLAKPFNPYELREKIVRLLTRPEPAQQALVTRSSEDRKAAEYLEYPFVPTSVSSLAKTYNLTQLPILIAGEAGCGQERIARSLHALRGTAGEWIAAYPAEETPDELFTSLAGFSRRKPRSAESFTLFIDRLEGLNRSSQAALLNFLQEEEERESSFWVVSTSYVDLLEKVYRGDFLGALYYRLATLMIRLPPLRQRVQDVPSLVGWFAEDYAERLDLGSVTFAPGAIERLCNYLWFGNLDEMELVIARTLATHRKGAIEASDLILDPGEEYPQPPSGEGEEALFAAREAGRKAIRIPSSEKNAESTRREPSKIVFSELKQLIHELAHELKNPMVTIKTFAQLLGERFNDETFRARFQQMVSSDIDRMDELLENIIEFSRFNEPAAQDIFIYEELSRVLEEIFPECFKKEATVRWLRKGEKERVFADANQLRYVLKNLLQSVLAQVKPGGEIQVGVEEEGKVAFTYLPEAERITGFAQYLEQDSLQKKEEALPLRILLAKVLLERNGGKVAVADIEGGKVLIRADLPVH
ncbi:MAG: sigma 54-interacting transcriptional regulator [Deltaproteobacteria bacterium]|nr:sigma 54-interacting transcriptional regulator [Deltaproteobacteria bacterium]